MQSIVDVDGRRVPELEAFLPLGHTTTRVAQVEQAVIGRVADGSIVIKLPGRNLAKSEDVLLARHKPLAGIEVKLVKAEMAAVNLLHVAMGNADGDEEGSRGGAVILVALVVQAGGPTGGSHIHGGKIQHLRKEQTHRPGHIHLKMGSSGLNIDLGRFLLGVAVLHDDVHDPTPHRCQLRVGQRSVGRRLNPRHLIEPGLPAGIHSCLEAIVLVVDPAQIHHHGHHPQEENGPEQCHDQNTATPGLYSCFHDRTLL